MDSNEKKFPVYAMLSIIIMGMLALFYILYIGQDILIPIVFSVIIAILLNPVVNFLNKKIHRVLSILIVLTGAILLIAALMYFIGSQVAMFSDSFPQIKEKFSILFNDIIGWVSQTFNLSAVKIHAWINKTTGEAMNNKTTVIGQTLLTIGNIIVYVFLVPVYVFLILFYKSLLLEFISRLFPSNKSIVVAEVLIETKTLIQSYLIGLLLEVVIVAILNAVGLLIIGLEYAILIGIIGALLNIIPYIGGLVAIAIPMLLALATKAPIDALWVFAVYMLIQFIDNNFIVPIIVASRVKVNALISVTVILIGGALWGVAGMFLSIPITAIVKVIFDRIEPLTPFGFLIGDDQPGVAKASFKFRVPAKKHTTKQTK